MAKAGKIVAWSFKALFYLFILTVNAIVLWRVFFSGDPSSLKGIMVNENTLEAYENNGGKLTLVTQKQRTITSSGLFSVTECIYIPEAKQLQVTVRYNNSTLKRTALDYDLESVPDRESEVYDVTVVKTKDLTPENTEDNEDPEFLSEERFFPSEVKSAYKRLYSYRKFIFDNVTYNGAVGLFVDIYYSGDADYEKTPYGALCIYDAETETETHALRSADKKALRAAMKNSEEK